MSTILLALFLYFRNEQPLKFRDYRSIILFWFMQNVVMTLTVTAGNMVSFALKFVCCCGAVTCSKSALPCFSLLANKTGRDRTGAPPSHRAILISEQRIAVLHREGVPRACLT